MNIKYTPFFYIYSIQQYININTIFYAILSQHKYCMSIYKSIYKYINTKNIYKLKNIKISTVIIYIYLTSIN